MDNISAFRKNVWYLIGATRGGPTRARLISKLLERPLNPHQLSGLMNMDYKTILHHLEVLRKNNWVTSKGDKYGNLFFTAFTEEENAAFHEIWAKIRENNFK